MRIIRWSSYLLLSTGFELGRGRLRGMIEIRHTLGLTPATRDSYSGATENGALPVNLGLAFRL